MNIQTSRHFGILALIIIGLAGCATQSQVPPPTTVVVDQPRQQGSGTIPAVTYDYTQTPETNQLLIPPGRVHEFVREFVNRYAGPNKAATTFAIRVNPTADGSSAANSPNASDQHAVAEYVHDFGRPLREGGMVLLNSEGQSAATPEIVLNINASVKQITIQNFDGKPITKNVPDVEVTAVRTSDGVVVGQANTADVIGDKPNAWVRVERVGAAEVMRATALVSLEDMAGRKLYEDFVAATSTLEPDTATTVTSPATSQPGIASTAAADKAKELPAWCWALFPDDKLKEKVNKLGDQQKAALHTKCEEYRAWQFALLPESRGKSDNSPKVVTPFLAAQMAGQ